MAEGISVGDAVLQFLGNTTQLDAAFDGVGPKAEAAFEPAAKAAEDFGDAAEDAGQRTQSSMRDARGEVALIGEEFGIHLPRHVRTFVAELPGVGEALQAAFSATAVIFVAQALAQVAEKLSKLTADYLIFTDEMKASEEEVGKHQTAMAALNATYDKDSEAIEKFGKTALQVALIDLAKLTKAAEDSAKATAALKAQALAVAEPGIWDTLKSVAAVAFLGYGQAAKQAGEQVALAAQVAKDKIDEADKDTANKKREEAEQKRVVQAEALKEFQAHILAMNEADNARTELYDKNMQAQNEAENARSALAKKAQAEYVAGVEKENEADNARTAMYKKDLEQENEAENARWAMQQGINKLDAEAVEARIKNDERLKKEDNDLKKQTEVTFQSLASSWMKAASPLKQLGAEGQEAFNKLTSGLESAVSASILSGASFGHAMEEMTRQVLAGISAQAAVKALYYLAEGTAAAFTPGMQGAASGYFLAAAEMGAIAGAAGTAAHFMPGGSSSGSSSNTEQSHSSGSSTGQSNRSGGSLVGVQGFADGGLIQAPTLAIMGEGSRREAVLPLEDPAAMDAIRTGIGGGGDTHFHIQGLVSDDKLVSIMKNMSKLVNKGKATLTASSSSQDRYSKTR